MKPIFLGALLTLVACRTTPTPDLPKVTAESPPSAPQDIAAKQPSPAEATPTGWTSGTPAKGTANALTPSPPVGVLVPAFIAERVTGPSLLFFYSPTCPHCQAVMPEINHLRETLPELHFIGIPTGSATPRQIDQFVKTYAADFEMVVDENRAFAQAVGARSTPTVYIARPNRSGETPVNAAYVEDGSAITLLEAFAPFGRGMASILAMRLHPEAPFSHFNSGYQGDRVCSVCHEEEALAWATTHHSMAYRTLYARDRATDEECVGCHVTGYKTETGFQTGDHSSALRDVTCEACHGPGGPHDGEPTDAQAACVGCHDAKHSIAFSLEKGLPLIDHYRANTMSEDAIRERLRALADGEAEKPLLAFPSGPTTGSQACGECHEEQHAWAQDDTHANAMRHLTGASQDDPACVRCHATPRALSSAGLPEDPSVAGHRTSEGVGCESCHGPGAEHAADPTSTNIVGLGESCPECVIEAICTSCHVPKWDPEWQLAPRLEAIAH